MALSKFDKWWNANPTAPIEEVVAKRDEFKQQTHAAQLQRQKNWRDNNKEHILKADKAYKAANKDRVAAIQKRYLIKHGPYWQRMTPEKRKQRTTDIYARRYEQKAKLMALFGNKCADCNQTFPDVCYDMHHKDPNEKEGILRDMVSWTWERALREAEKCVMLCANCHRIRHWSNKEKQNGTDRT